VSVCCLNLNDIAVQWADFRAMLSCKLAAKNQRQTNFSNILCQCFYK